MYSVAERDSFESVPKIIKYIQSVKNMPAVLVGNNKYLSENKRAVQYEEGKNLAIKYNITFMELNMNNSSQIDEPLFVLGRLIMYSKGWKSISHKSSKCILS